MSIKKMKRLLIVLSVFCSACAQEKSSLTFVIDDTGSMGNDIAAVKAGANAIFDTVMTSNSSQIEDFVLVTFNDPHFRHRITTKDRDRFKEALAEIEVDGGGDCPENAMSGIELALQESRPGSLLYVFTDASAKDPEKHDFVKILAQKKQIQIVFVLTGDCRREGNEEVYYSLAEETSGQVFHLDHKDEVSKILKYVETQINSRKTIVTRKNFPPGTHSFDYLVDSKMKELIISISGTNPEVVLTDPEGDPAPTEDIVRTSKVAILRVKEITPGVYTAEIKSPSKTSIVVTAETTVHFQHGFSMYRPMSIIDTATRPIPGYKSYLSIKLSTEGVDDIILDTAQILDMENNVITEKRLKEVNGTTNFYITESFITPHNTTFRIAIKGHSTNNNQITRISLTPIEPQVIDKTVPNKAPMVEIVGEHKVNVEYTKPITLRCKISAKPKPDVIWEDRNGTELKSELSLVELPYDYLSVLVIHRVISNDTYKCKAINGDGNNSAEVVVETKKNIFFNVLKKPKGATIELDHEARFECEVDANPPAETKWFRNGVEINDKNIDISPDGSVLVIKNMFPRNVGKYSCITSNENTAKVYNFAVEISGVEKPEINKTISEIRVKEGLSVDIPCMIIKSKPRSKINWFFKQESERKEKRIDESEDDDAIHLEDVSPAFSGTYRCEADNDVGTDFHNIYLILESEPKIESGATNIIAQQGDKVKLPCIVHGKPVPNVTWFFNDTMIDASLVPHYSIAKNSIVFKAKEHDSGIYVCQATNEHGSANKTMHVGITGPPTIEVPKETALDVNVGEHIALPCNAKGFPQPNITWVFYSKNSKAPAKNLRATDSSGMLLLSRIQVTKEGYYTCIASNVGGSSNITYEIRVFVPPNIENVYPEKTFKAVVGDLTLRVPCKATGNPKPDITWIKDGVDKVPAGTEWYDIDADGTLVIKNVDKLSAGTYVCQAKNRMGFDNETYEVVVDGYPATGSPTKEILTKIGDSTHVKCDVPNMRIKKTDSVRWFKDGILLSIYHEYHLVKAQLADSGIYTCRVSNFEKSASGNIRVKVGFKPRFLYEEEHNIDFEDGLTAVMDCAVEGVPTPEVSWWHNGEKLPITENTYIIDMKPKDRGQYFCLVKNDFGDIVRGFDITSRECLLDITADLKGNQPLIITPNVTWPKFDTINGYLNIPSGEYLRLSCPNGFKDFRNKVEMLVKCERENHFRFEKEIYRFSDYQCRDKLMPVFKRTGKKCMPAKIHSETIIIGYEVHGKFLKVYSVCLDTQLNVPLYTKHNMHHSLSNVLESGRTRWYKSDLVPLNFDGLYNCEMQTNTITKMLGKRFHTSDKCCFAKRQLVNPRDVFPGLPQLATYSYMNVVPHWSTCNSKNWESVEKRVRALAKSTNEELYVWTGTAQELEIDGKYIKIYDKEYKSQPVSRYLWKVVQDPSTKASLAIIQLNIPDLTLATAFGHMICRDICREVAWMKNYKHWRDVHQGYTFCCSITDFERAFGLTGLFGTGPRKVLYDISLVPDISLT